MKILLLVQNEDDVALLSDAAKAILSTNIDDVWLVFSPMVTVDQVAAAKKYDAEIASLEAHAKQAAALLDTKGFEDYVLRLNAKKLERATALREAHKTAPAEEKKARINAIFKPFRDTLEAGGVSAKITQHESHFEREQYIEFQKSLTGAWLPHFTIGKFGIHWPGSIPSAKLPSLAERLGPTPLDRTRINAGENTPLSPAEEKEIKVVVPQTRGQELAALHPMKLGPLMKSLGLDPEGLSRAEKIAAILAAEAKPETVDAY